MKGGVPEPWKWASKPQVRTFDTVHEKVVVVLAMLLGVCAAIGAGVASNGSLWHNALERHTGLLLLVIGLGGTLLVLVAGAIVGVCARRKTRLSGIR